MPLIQPADGRPLDDKHRRSSAQAAYISITTLVSIKYCCSSIRYDFDLHNFEAPAGADFRRCPGLW